MTRPLLFVVLELLQTELGPAENLDDEVVDKLPGLGLAGLAGQLGELVEHLEEDFLQVEKLVFVLHADRSQDELMHLGQHLVDGLGLRLQLLRGACGLEELCGALVLLGAEAFR